MVYVSLGYIPGHIHAFWLIYKKMEAEERYGHGGFLCETITFIFSLLSSVLMLMSNKRYWKWTIPTSLQRWPGGSRACSQLRCYRTLEGTTLLKLMVAYPVSGY